MGGHEVVSAREVGGVHAPCAVPADEAPDDVGERVRDVRVCQLGLQLATRRVLEHDAGSGDGRRGVGEVVRDDLMPVELRDGDATAVAREAREVKDGGVDECGGGIDGRARGNVGVGHGRPAYRRAR